MSAFDTDAQKKRRRVRRDADDDDDATLVGFQTTAGDEEAWHGDDDAPWTEPLGRASEDGSTGLVSVGNGQNQRIAVDGNGIIWIRSLIPGGTEGAALRYTSSIVETSAEIKVGAGRVFSAEMVLDGGGSGDRVLMLFDAAAAPSDGATPIWRGVLPDPGGGNFGQVEVSFGEIDGLVFNNGLYAVISTTAATLTAPPGDEALFQVTYV